MAVDEHRSSAPSARNVRVAVISVSDTRTRETDGGGALVETMAAASGFSICGRQLVPDDEQAVRSAVAGWLTGTPADVVILTGGTGMAPRDVTVDAVAPLFKKRLDGFGELFRILSFAEIGAAAMLSRATAGIVGRTAIFALPGSPAAIRLALEKLILPELGHLVAELSRHASPGEGHAENGAAETSGAPSRARHGGHGESHHR